MIKLFDLITQISYFSSNQLVFKAKISSVFTDIYYMFAYRGIV